MRLKGTAAGIAVLMLCTALTAQGKIDRRAVVRRHNITIDSTQGRSPGQVGNGRFAFGFDVTGLQSFTPFNTLSDWGWHSSPLPEGKSLDDYRPVEVESHGVSIPYMHRNDSVPEISNYMRCNPHRVHLGRIGFVLLKEDGTGAAETDLVGCTQSTDLWTGIVRSTFTLDGTKISVVTSCDPASDIVSVRVRSALLREGRLKVFIDFPYWDGREFSRFVGDYSCPEKHSSAINALGCRDALLCHTMDDLSYSVALRWSGKRTLEHEGRHKYVLSGEKGEVLNFTAEFLADNSAAPAKMSPRRIERRSAREWKKYWKSGAALDLSGSTDPRWKEFERRCVLSQYVLRLNESGDLPPQESGLVNNGWFGRFHFEMIWWHGAHYFQWGRPECFDGALDIYRKFLPTARERAASEGRSGARWPKCTGNVNREWPCDTHAFLCWQQPHPIYFAEMEYRLNPCAQTLEKWKEIVFETAEYLASSVFREGDRYVIGPPVTAVSENTDPLTTENPIFELSYYRYGLRTALEWARRVGKTDVEKWLDVLENLAELPQEDGMYKTAETMRNMWTEKNFEHPALTGVYGWLPGDGVDTEIARRTLHEVLEKWQMDRIWGWDYPMLAMAAARLGEPSLAVDLLCTESLKFAFDVHGLADTWPFPYFPANGGLLSAVAMMCGGWDGCTENHSAPGFPKDGGWNVKYEGFERMQ